MYPYLLPEVFGYKIPMYDVLMFIGVFLMLIYIIRRFDKIDGFKKEQTNKIIIITIISLVFSLAFSYFLDGIFHSIRAGEWTFGTISFLGALVGGLGAFLLLMKVFYKDDNKDMKKITNTLITGVVLAHAIGRIGCFMAGCCYGIPTNSFLGVIFPYGFAGEDFHGVSIFPTQLFEALFLFALFFFLNNVKVAKAKELEIYLISYGFFRFFIEFIRGDNRGSFLTFFETTYGTFPSPSQFISFMMIILGLLMLFGVFGKLKILNKSKNA